MPDPIRIRSGSAGKHWPEVGRVILAHWLASGPDPFGLLPDRIRLACFRTGSVWLASGPDPFGQNLTQSARNKSDPGWLCTILSGTFVEEPKRA